MQVVFDHVHLVVTQPLAAANWFVDVLEGVRLGEATVLGSPQAYIRFGDSLVIVRGRRPGEPERVPAPGSMPMAKLWTGAPASRRPCRPSPPRRTGSPRRPAQRSWAVR